MPANPWRLQADTAPLVLAAQHWTEVGATISTHGDDFVEAARRASEDWESASAESYELHRRHVVQAIDRFAELATQMSTSLQAVAALMTTTQDELDRSWARVAMIPHSFVGTGAMLVFDTFDPEDQKAVTAGRAEASQIRAGLASLLDQEADRLSATRAELNSVRTELTTLAQGAFPTFAEGGIEPVVAAGHSTSVAGSAQSGVVLAPLSAPTPVSMPTLGGVSAGAVAPLVAGAVSALARRRRTGEPSGGAPIGGMGAAAGARGGSAGRAGQRPGASVRRMATPRLTPASAADGDEADARAKGASQEKEAARTSKRAAIEERRADRAARRAAREERSGEGDDETTPEVRAEAQVQTGGEAAAEVQTGAEVEVQAEAEVQAVTEPEIAGDADADSTPDPVLESEAQTEAEQSEQRR